MFKTYRTADGGEHPRLVSVETTSRCNAECPFCPCNVRARDKSHMTQELFEKIIDDCTEFPLPAIVKPSAEDASVGIDNGAVCTSKRALKKRVALMLEQFEEVLVQEYVAGREFNVGFVGKRMLPIAEIQQVLREVVGPLERLPAP